MQLLHISEINLKIKVEGWVNKYQLTVWNYVSTLWQEGRNKEVHGETRKELHQTKKTNSDRQSLSY